MAREIADGQHGAYDSLLIAQGGKLLFESYFRRGRVNLTHPQVSATKSYTALALGRAIQLGYLTMADLDRPIIEFLDRLDPQRLPEGADSITLHKALTMSSGLRLTEEQEKDIDEHPAAAEGQGQVQAYLEKSAPITPASQTFKYQGTDPNLVMQVLEAVVPGSAEDFLRGELFDKMGITTYSWQRDAASGLPRGGDRASLSSRAMVKWGLLVLRNGKWGQTQLVPKAYIERMTKRHVRLGPEEAFFASEEVRHPGYGYLWWQADMHSGGKSYFSTSAQGGGGQHIIVIKELDLVIVVTAHGAKSPVMQLTPQRILPALTP
ncbi:MAG: serine hydrolase [Myxococcota bacterium]